MLRTDFFLMSSMFALLDLGSSVPEPQYIYISSVSEFGSFLNSLVQARVAQLNSRDVTAGASRLQLEHLETDQFRL